MTCIVGVAEKGIVTIGGDSAGIAGSSLTLRADQKVFRNGPFVMGFTSSYRMGQLLRYKFQAPAHPKGMDTFEYMVTLFVDALRECLKTGGFARKTNEEETGGIFLVGYRGRLFRVEGDYQVGENISRYDSCGCGQEIARGALYASSAKRARDKAETALRAAEQWNTDVRRPFHFVSTAA